MVNAEKRMSLKFQMLRKNKHFRFTSPIGAEKFDTNSIGTQALGPPLNSVLTAQCA